MLHVIQNRWYLKGRESVRTTGPQVLWWNCPKMTQSVISRLNQDVLDCDRASFMDLLGISACFKEVWL
jgi:hypothetical protein